MIDSSSTRIFFQNIFVTPLAKVLPLEVSPTNITFTACLFGLAIAPLLALGMASAAFSCLLFTGYLDILDGTLARLRSVTSAHGTVLDIVSDRIVETAIILGFFFVDPQQRAFACLLMLAAVLICVTSFLVVGIFTENSSEKSFHYSPGLVERGEAFLFFGAMILLPNFFIFLAYLFAALVLFTALKRVLDYLPKG